MKMLLNKNIAEVKKDFTAFFPGLSIEFYKMPHAIGAGSTNKDKIEEDKLLKDIADNLDTSFIEIDQGMTVGELEMQFQKSFGLSIQVFRKSGDLWLQTSSTDNWSLEKQNAKGQESVNA